jgi:DNA-binding CsgD family transcriptional regulator
MQVIMSLVCLVVLLLGLHVVLYVLRLRERRERERRLALTKEMLFLSNCSDYELSGREVEVVRLMLEGKTYKEVGELLFISEKTVDSHMQHIYSKVRVNSKLALLNKLYN